MTYENERGTRWRVRQYAGGWWMLQRKLARHFTFGWLYRMREFDSETAAEAALTAMAEKNGWTLVPDKEA